MRIMSRQLWQYCEVVRFTHRYKGHYFRVQNDGGQYA
jgi:hypothetical protein